MFRRGGRTGSSRRRGAVSGARKAADAWPDMAPGWEEGKAGMKKGRSPERGAALKYCRGAAYLLR
ncbi:hypothetical protein DFS30_07330 [Akkermansia muciniphila]|nr:hypothetical protein CXU04_09660 [Akkermansia muciniphila]PNC76127.1 hypothetical protein CXT98_02810 [Akkermansia muciniphila]PNC79930.1 hypothetical protein CXU01_08605 [Akkermansia muciniphila]QAA39125.1 hypothetical protein C1I90_07660 [Akkermansia muciniphila]QAA62317.1 hypothetical protein C1O59_07470 [Akkermansia muciniphila]